MFPLPTAQTSETRLLVEVGILGPRDTSVPVISGMRTDAVCSFLPQCGLEEQVSALGCCKSAFCYTDKLEYWSRSRTGLVGRDIRDPGRIYVIVPPTAQRISQLYRVCLCYFAYGQGYCLILVHRICLLLHHV